MNRMLRGAEGALGGFVATSATRFVLRWTNALEFDVGNHAIDPGEFVVSSVEEAIGSRLPRDLHQDMARTTAYFYGVTWPTLILLAAPRLAPRNYFTAFAKGPAFGLAAYLLTFGIALPAARLTPSIHKRRPTETTRAALAHAAWGFSVCLTVLALERLGRKR